MRAGVVRLLLAVGVLAVGVLAAPAGAAGPSGPWHAWVGTSGDNAGHGVVDKGEAIWTNYLFDDYGANVDGFQSMDPDLLIALLSPHAYPGDPTRPVGFAPSGNVGRFRHTGDYGYPPSQAYPHDPVNDPLGDNNAYDNVANVAETRVSADAQYVYLRFSLTDLGGDPALGTPKPDSTVVGVAIDTDANQATGGGAWPFGANLSSPGWDRFLTVWGTGGALTSPAGTSQDLVRAGGAVREDLAANTIDVRIPLAAIAPAGQRRWRLIAGTGRWDASQKAWAQPSLTTTQTTSPGNLMTYPRVYELPFHHDEPNSLWSETKQANDLRDGSVSSDEWTVDLAQLGSGATVAVPCTAGPKEETFNAYPPGSPIAKGLTALPTQNGGVANVHNVNYIYRWHVQPLALMLPPSVCESSAPAPSLDFFFHPANVNQNAWFVGVEGSHDRVDYLDDPPLSFSYVTSLAARYNRITAAGLGRTEGWNYGDAPGEEAADWDAFQATTSRYRYNPDHVRVTGMSGRLGAPFFAETWPDRVASMYTVSNHTADSPKIANLRNTPWVFMHGTAFLELQSDLPGYATLDDHLNALGYQYLHMTWNGRGHDFNLLNEAYGLVEPWTSAPRIHPARITYYLDPKDRRPGLSLFPGVDWVRDLSLADPKRPAQIDLTDSAKANELPVRETRFDCTFTNLGTGDNVEYHGLSYETPAVVRARMPDVVAQGWSANSCALTTTPQARPTVANAVAGTLVNVSSVTLAGDRMGLHLNRPVDLSGIKSATPVTVRLVWARGRRTFTIGGSACAGSTVLRFRLHHPRGLRVVRAALWVDGRRRSVLHGRSLHEISIPRPTNRRFTVIVKTRLSNGATIRRVRHFAACVKTRPKITTRRPRAGPSTPPAGQGTTGIYAPLDRPGPPLDIPAGALRAALACTAGVRNARRDPILLVPGTELDPELNFGWNYERAFTQLGWPYCTITLPGHTTEDIQRAGEYIVYALRTMHGLAGRKVDILGYSQGGMVPRWALRFWPDTRRLVGAFVALDPSNHGTLDADVICKQPCSAADWQQASSAHFIQALNSGAETFAGISYTVIYSRTDEVVVPNADSSGSSSLHTGAGQIANIAVQDICPNDTSEHFAMGSYDPVGYALAIDAFTHPGPANPALIPRTVCASPFQPGVDPATFPSDYVLYLNGSGTSPSIPAEPPLAAYVYNTAPNGPASQQTAGIGADAPSGTNTGRASRRLDY